jgi:SAM-dependent methyltransferase
VIDQTVTRLGRVTENELPPGLELACPSCTGRLAVADEVLVCGQCSQHWPFTGGVANLGEAPDFPQDFPQEQLAELLNISETSGWQSALHDHMRPLDARRYRQAVDEYRAQWRCLVPAHPRARVLDLRCGWGPISVCLAEDNGLVVAADTSMALARFTALRAAAMGANNVQTLAFDPRRRWPFPAGYFHGIVLQAALEWADAPTLLAEAARVLAPGGWLLAHVPNRLNAARLLRAAQTRLRRPGQAAQNGSSAAADAQAQPRTLGGYRRALAQAGLAPRATYALLPSEAEPFACYGSACTGCPSNLCCATLCLATRCWRLAPEPIADAIDKTRRAEHCSARRAALDDCWLP